jgi:hypothetical protein
MDVNLNARLMPLDRGGRFEDPLEELLREKLRRFEVTGGGTMMNKNREPVSCDIEISFKGNADGRCGWSRRRWSDSAPPRAPGPASARTC